ncbi:LCP family glycopolymer transferase [Macrococcus equipercicus]|uniref:LCP family protein n=1 Tax=Macrococcus equipercicus TaxID=69967 RepID=A0A9Q9F162_9STAP|nr:LCP family protein [Macrococcus equipercicus]UTH13587.1 LCP family protein [Macrococcus equipercicus]
MKKRKGCFIPLIILSLVIIAGAGFLGYSYFKVKGTADSIHKPIENRKKSELRDSAVAIDRKDPISVALFGVDSNVTRLATGDAGRSDTIMLLSINPSTKKTVMVSIPRDTYSTMVGKGTQEKIAHAYAYGGAAMAVKSVEQLMGVPIDYYATINMDGMKDMIDNVGGVKVVSNATFTVRNYQFVEGQAMKMDGNTAMAFIRSRKEDGSGGDFGRQERQQLVVQALAKKVLSVGSVSKLDGMLKTISGNVVTDLSFNELESLGTSYTAALDHVEKHQLEGTGQTLDDGLWYFMADEKNKQHIKALYMKNLNK